MIEIRVFLTDLSDLEAIRGLQGNSFQFMLFFLLFFYFIPSFSKIDLKKTRENRTQDPDRPIYIALDMYRDRFLLCRCSYLLMH